MAIKKTGRLFYPPFFCRISYMTIATVGDWVLAVDFTRTFNSLVDNIDWDLLGRTIGTGINTIVNTLDLFYTGIDWKNLGSKFAEGVNGVVYEVDWAKLGQFIGHKLLALPTVIVGFIENLDWSALSKAASTLVLNFLDTLIEFIHNIDWSKIVTNIQDALTNIQWIAIAEKILELLGYALGSITGALAKNMPTDFPAEKI